MLDTVYKRPLETGKYYLCPDRSRSLFEVRAVLALCVLSILASLFFISRLLVWLSVDGVKWALPFSRGSTLLVPLLLV